jgi:tetratricopeptide (TPR) repeat protein
MGRSLPILVLALPVLGACASSPSTRGPAPPPAPKTSPAANAVEEGVALYEQERYAEAEAVLAPLPGPRARAYLAASRVRLRRYAGAETPALEALRASPADPVASAALGEALVAQGKLGEAIRRLTVVIRADPRLPYAYYWRGQAYHRNRQIARMVDDYQAFLRLAPGAPEAPAVRALLAGLS